MDPLQAIFLTPATGKVGGQQMESAERFANFTLKKHPTRLDNSFRPKKPVRGALAVAIAPNEASREVAREMQSNAILALHPLCHFSIAIKSGWRGLGRCVGDLKETAA